MALAYIEKVSTNRAAFEQKVNRISANLGIVPDWLMTVMYAESGLNHLAENPKSTAIGLIQFLDSTLKNLGTTRNYLKSLTNVQQLDWVEKYFVSLGLKGKMKSVYDVYFAVFSPKYVGNPDGTVIATSGQNVYNANKALDTDKDGRLTVLDVKTWFGKYIRSGTPTETQNNIITPVAVATGASILYLLYRWSKNKNTTKQTLSLS